MSLIIAVFLPPPPNCPDLNPIERLRQRLKRHQMAGYITKCGEELKELPFESLRTLLDRPESIRPIYQILSW